MVDLKVLLAFFVIALMAKQGFARGDNCDLKSLVDMSINIKDTSMRVKGKETVEVEVFSNDFLCKYLEVHIKWKNFNPVVPLDPNIVKPIGSDGTTFLLLNGGIFYGGYPPRKFYYTGAQGPPKPGDLCVASALTVCQD